MHVRYMSIVTTGVGTPVAVRDAVMHRPLGVGFTMAEARVAFTLGGPLRLEALFERRLVERSLGFTLVPTRA